ncbi:hydantoinase/oxoprolinase family protein [Bosea sp. 117]|uniref:hydantoinase/oxoprolinase family protein n=1 Tax=Bosea sp. 117 TaxID=1125973 RepID=UPI000494D565|nr:hydantoinase/oxoprolinase family protein [Bosea sp. 117]
MRQARIGVDIGGTFTDLVLLDSEGRAFFAKVASTPDHPEQAVLTGVAQILETAGLGVGQVVEVLHGTTVGSNTLLQKAGARTGLITTRGFRDVLEIGRVRTPTMFDLSWTKPEPLVARRYRREVDERTTAGGEILKTVDIDQVLEIGRDFVREGIESVAICFLNSYSNGENEAEAARALSEAFPELWVTASVAVLPEIREYERTSTTAVNAYVLPALRSYIERLETGLRDIGVAAPLLVSNSNGGLSAAAIAQEKPVFFISSGRAAGVVGAGRLGTAIDERNLIVFDMGGTTASASLIHDGKLTRTNEYEFRAGISTPSRFIKAGGYLMRVPTIDVAEVGSGAGSIAWLDPGKLLNVGPVSAGAKPGPACYGAGGTSPTVTDANVVLGFLPAELAGGTLTLDVAKARDAVERDVAGPLGLTVEAAATGIREIVNVNMARAIRAVTVERGVDPRDFTLLAFGGSGPVHACDLARSLGIGRVLFPRAPGVFTAMGMLAGSVEHYFLRAFPTLLRKVEAPEIGKVVADLRTDAVAALAREGYPEDRIAFEFELDLRFRGQDSELAVPLGADGFDAGALREAFLESYRGIYGYASRDDVEIVNVRLRARGISAQNLDFAHIEAGQLAPGEAVVGRRPIYFSRDTGWVDTPVIERAALSGEVEGPVVLQSADTTIIVPPGARAGLDPVGNVVVTL